MSYGSSWLVIWALILAPMALVSALRETSIVFAVTIGVVFLQERLSLARFRYYGSAQLFSDTMRRFIDLGIPEIGIGYPRDAAQLPLFEAIAREVIPRLKEELSALRSSATILGSDEGKDSLGAAH